MSIVMCESCGEIIDTDYEVIFWHKNGKQYHESAAQTGEKNHLWQGGISFGKYCPIFNPKFKEGVREVFHHTCMICDHVWQIGEKKLSVHHVYYNKRSCCGETEDGHYIHTLPEGEKVLVIGNPNKFVTLCTGKCHAKTNHNRLYWALHFEKLINEKFGGISYIANSKKERKNTINFKGELVSTIL